MPRKATTVEHLDDDRLRVFVRAFIAHNFTLCRAAEECGLYDPGARARRWTERTRRRKATAWGKEVIAQESCQRVLHQELNALLHRHEVTAARVLREYCHVAFARQTDYMRERDDGTWELRPFAEWPIDADRAIRKMTVTETRTLVKTTTLRDEGGEVEATEELVNVTRKTELELHAKMQALRDVGEHLKMFVKTLKVDGALDVTHRHELVPTRESLTDALDDFLAGDRPRFPPVKVLPVIDVEAE